MMDPNLYAKVDVAYNDNLMMLTKYIPLLKWRNTEKETALDVGCGTGRVTWKILRPLLPAKIQLVGSDVNAKMLEFSAENYPELKTFQLDIGTKELPDHLRESFDHLFSFYALMWVQNIRQALQNIYNILKPGGQFFGYYLGSDLFLDTYQILSQSEKWMNYIPDVKKTCHYYDYDELNVEDVQKLYEEVGFKISLCNIEYKNIKLSSIEELKSYLIGVCPDYSKLPTNLKEEFANDALETLFQHKIWKKENSNSDSNQFFVPLNFVIIHVTK